MASKLGDKIDRQITAIPVLIACRTKSDACKELGMSRETLNKWFKEPEFIVMYRAAQREVYDFGMAKVVGLVQRAINVLRDILDDADASSAFRIQAAQTVLNHAKNHCLDMDLEDRVIELEKKLSDLSKDA